ncbi:MAG: hypothetical protein NZ651_01510 [Candidatus Bipolaricaulota bacterium]|nr:hypothetical protein [Candidatus Bipolaricaulota bacterium]MDW8126440.1 hypothetical protein [Candidatus Bipolaricaulota bacterium]
MGIGVWFWALGTLPLAMAGAGGVALGPQPWLTFPVGPVQTFLGWTDPPWAVRVPILDGPWFAWVEVPPLRLAVGRSPGHALVALVRDPKNLYFSWEILGAPWFSLFGSLGGENACGLRLRWKELWAAALIRKGDFSLWCGAYF